MNEVQQQIVKDLEQTLSTFDDKTMSDNRGIFFKILKCVHEDGYNFIDDAEDYAEPGYDLEDPAMPLLFANWNKDTRWNRETQESEVLSNLMPLLCDLAEKTGCSIEWSDEWAVCECRKAFRTSGDSYSWTMYGAIIDSDYVCGDCVKEDPDFYFEEISGDPTKAITIYGVDPTQYGYARIAGTDGLAIFFEHGMYGGQDASPTAIADTLKSAGIEDFLFSIHSTGQFDLKFSVFVRDEAKDVAFEALSTGNTTCDLDPAEALRKGLAAVSAKAKTFKEGDTDDGSIQYATVNADGTVSTRQVSPEEFIAGIKAEPAD